MGLLDNDPYDGTMLAQLSPQEEAWKKYSRGKRYGEMLSPEEQAAPFEALPDKTIGNYTFEHVDPRQEWSIVPLSALPKFDLDHYDRGGKYDHWDPETKTYWRLKAQERPMS